MLMRAGAELPRDASTSPRCASSPAWASRSTPRRCCGARGAGPAHPRQLVADRDRRDHDRQLRGRWTSGPARWAGRCRASRRPSCGARADGGVEPMAEPGVEGELALRPGWPSMFRGYLDEEERYRSCFAGGWYLTGDLARRDADGYFWFVGRADDVIKSVRPPHRPLRGGERAARAPGGGGGRRHRQARPGGGRGGEGLRLAQARARADRRRCGWSCWASRAGGWARRWRPRRSDFLATLPRTRSGKIMRRLLKARELGLPEGDLSTLEGPHERARPLHRARHGAAAACGEMIAHPPLRGALRRAVRARGRSAASSTSTSARRRCAARGDSGHLRRTRPIVSTTASTATRWPGACRARAVMAEMFGKAAGLQPRPRRLDAPLRRRDRFYGGNAIVAGGLPLAVGLALADKLRGRRGVTACFFGDGAVAEGEFHESMNLAALWQLPVLFALREQPLRHGHRARVATRRRSTCRQGQQLRARRRGGGRHGRAGGGRGGEPGARWRRAPGEGPDVPGAADLPLPGPLDVRPRALPHQGRGRRLDGARPHHRCSTQRLREAGLLRPSDAEALEARARGRGGGRRGGLRRGGHPRAGRALLRDVAPAGDLQEGRADDRPPTARRCAKPSARRCARTPGSSSWARTWARYGGGYAVSQRAARGVRPRAHSRHAALRVGLRGRRHRRGAQTGCAPSSR